VPDASSVVQGSVFGYQVTALNTTTAQQCFQYWENVSLPNGSVYPSGGEIFGPVDLCLAPGGSKSLHLTHGVPASAPVGTYAFNAYVGAYFLPTYHVVVDETHPAFNVTPVVSPVVGGSAVNTSWNLVEKGFRK
jgi:hypothetical protein